MCHLFHNRINILNPPIVWNLDEFSAKYMFSIVQYIYFFFFLIRRFVRVNCINISF